MAGPTPVALSTFRLTAWQSGAPPATLSPPSRSSSLSSSSSTKAGTYLLSHGGGFALAPPFAASDSSAASLLTFGYTPSLSRLQAHFPREESQRHFAPASPSEQPSKQLQNSRFCSATFPSSACCQASVAAAKAANCPVVAAATAWPALLFSQKRAVADALHSTSAAAHEGREAPSRSNAFRFPVVVGLENGQVWLYQWRQVPHIDTDSKAGEQAAKRDGHTDGSADEDREIEKTAAGSRKLAEVVPQCAVRDAVAKVKKENERTSGSTTATPSCSARHLIACRMAQPLRICIGRYRAPVGGERAEDDGKQGKLSESDAEEEFDVSVLYSDGVVIVWQRKTRRRIELPPLAGAVGMSVDADCRFIAVSCSTRRLVVYARQELYSAGSAAAATCVEKQQEHHREQTKQQREFAAGDLLFKVCFNEEVFRKVLFSDAVKGFCLQTAWHPHKARLFLPGAPSVRALELPSGEIQELAFASTKDPLLVFDKVELLPLSPHFPGKPATPGNDKRETLLLLASVGPQIKAWSVNCQQLLFTVHAADVTAGGFEGPLGQLTAWPALVGAKKQQRKQQEGGGEQEARQQQQAEDEEQEHQRGQWTWSVDVGVLRAGGSLGVIRYCCSSAVAEEPQQQDNVVTAPVTGGGAKVEETHVTVTSSSQKTAASAAHENLTEGSSAASTVHSAAAATAISEDQRRETTGVGAVVAAAEVPATASGGTAPHTAAAAEEPAGRAAEEAESERGKTEAENKQEEEEEGDAGPGAAAAAARRLQQTSSFRAGKKRKSSSRSSEEEEQDEEQQGAAEADVRRFVSLQAEEASEGSSDAESNKLFEEEEEQEDSKRSPAGQRQFSASSRSSDSSSSGSSDSDSSSSNRRTRKGKKRGRSAEDSAAAANEHRRQLKKMLTTEKATTEKMAAFSGKETATAEDETAQRTGAKRAAEKSRREGAASTATKDKKRAVGPPDAPHAAETSDFPCSSSSSSESDGDDDAVKASTGITVAAAETPGAAVAAAGNVYVKPPVTTAAAEHVEAAAAAVQRLNELAQSFTRLAALPSCAQNGSVAAADERAGASGARATVAAAAAAKATEGEEEEGNTCDTADAAAAAETEAAPKKGNLYEVLQQTVAAVEKGMLALVQEQRMQQHHREKQQEQQQQHRREQRDRLRRLKKENAKLRRGMRQLLQEFQQQQEQQQQEQQRQRKLLQRLEKRGEWSTTPAAAAKTRFHITRALMPGACKQPADAAVPWCLFWNQHGHVSKMQQNEKITLEVFCFAAAAALAGVSRKRLIDYGDACMAALSKIGVALACSGDPRRAIPSRVEFRSLVDSCQWSKTLPGKERAVGVAIGDSFVAAVSSASLLHVFTPGGVALSLTRLPGYPVGLCGHHQLLLVLAAASPSAAVCAGEGGGAAAAAEKKWRRQQRLRGRSSSGTDSSSFSSDDTGRPGRSSGRAAAAAAAATRSDSPSSFIYICTLLHIHPPPAAPAAAYRFPFGCRDRLQKTPPAMAKVFPHVDVLHEGPLVLDSPVDWVHISNEGMPAVKDTSGTVWGLLPMWGTPGESAYVPYRFSWAPLLNLRDAAAASSSPIDEDGAAGGAARAAPVKYWPVYIDDMRSELVAVRLSNNRQRKGSRAAEDLRGGGGGAGGGEQRRSLSSCSDSASDEGKRGTSTHRGSGNSSQGQQRHRSSRAAARAVAPEEPDCSTSAPLFGHRLDQLPLRLPLPDVWEYPRWHAAVRQDRRLQPLAAAASSSSFSPSTGVAGGGSLETAEAGSTSESSRNGRDSCLAVAAVPWQQYDEIRLRTDNVIRLLCMGLKNWGGGAAAGGGMGTPEQQQQLLLKEEQMQEAREAEKKMKLLCKTHDKFAVREFVAMKEDRRLHLAALDVMLRFKLPQVAAGVRTQLEDDCRMQTAKLLEAIHWQQEEAAADPLALGLPACAASSSVPASAAAAVASLPSPSVGAAASAAAAAAEERELREGGLRRPQQQEQQHPPGAPRRRFPQALAAAQEEGKAAASVPAFPSLWKDATAAAGGGGGGKGGEGREKQGGAGQSASRFKFSHFLRGSV